MSRMVGDLKKQDSLHHYYTPDIFFEEKYDSPVPLHDVLKRTQEILLESEVGELSFLDKLHGELTQRIHSKEGDVFVRVAAHLTSEGEKE